MTNRRNFIRWGIFGLLLSRIFPRSSSVLAQNKFYKVGTIAQLDSQGFLLNEDLEIGAVFVKRKDDKSLIAIDPTCTHAGCIVEWKDKKNTFVCPCHASEFKQDGTRIKGLAKSNLSKYQVKTNNNDVLVSKQ
jgi:cytochrome b6-f complex iron-sulfur subunit